MLVKTSITNTVLNNVKIPFTLLTTLATALDCVTCFITCTGLNKKRVSTLRPIQAYCVFD